MAKEALLMLYSIAESSYINGEILGVTGGMPLS